jgi:hypothetical protein
VGEGEVREKKRVRKREGPVGVGLRERWRRAIEGEDNERPSEEEEMG